MDYFFLYIMWQTVTEMEEAIAEIVVHICMWGFVYHCIQMLLGMCPW